MLPAYGITPVAKVVLVVLELLLLVRLATPRWYTIRFIMANQPLRATKQVHLDKLRHLKQLSRRKMQQAFGILLAPKVVLEAPELQPLALHAAPNLSTTRLTIN